MAVISKRLGYLFIMAPRTACTTIGLELIRHFDGEWFPAEDVLSNSGVLIVPRKHSTVPQLLGAGIVDEAELAAKTVFTTVRNPFDSLVSLWHKQANAYQPLLDDPESFIHKQPDFKRDVIVARDQSFSEWIEYRFAPALEKTPRHLYAGFINRADIVMRYENLQEDFDDVLQKLGAAVTSHEIPIFNTTEGRERDYRQYYDSRAVDLVSRVFAKDLERFGYEF